LSTLSTIPSVPPHMMGVHTTPPSPPRGKLGTRSGQSPCSRRDLLSAVAGALLTVLLLSAWRLATPPAPVGAGAAGAPLAATASTAAAGGAAEALTTGSETTSVAGGDGSGGLWMTPAEARLIRSAMFPSMRYLEYGSGGSTIPFGRLASVAYSVEHDAEWCERMKPTLIATPHISMVCSPVARAPAGSGGWGSRTPFDAADFATFRAYVHAPDALPPAAFDVVLIDGRARLACALYVLRKLTPTSVVIIHDGNRKRYQHVAKYYTEVGRETGGKGAVLLRPRKKFVGVALADADIEAAYAKVARIRAGWHKSDRARALVRVAKKRGPAAAGGKATKRGAAGA